MATEEQKETISKMMFFYPVHIQNDFILEENENKNSKKTTKAKSKASR